MMEDKEKFYDESIAPELARLAELCHERGISFLAAVEYGPGSIACTSWFVEGYSWPLEMIAEAVEAMGNIDLFLFSAKLAAKQRDDVRADTSIFLREGGGDE